MELTKVKNLIPRKMHLTTFHSNGEDIDKGLCVWFPAPKTFTGEDIVEFQVHGSLAVVNRLYKELDALGFTLAEKGEFTRRAFFNQKIDLVKVEGLSNLLNSETEIQRKLAFSQFGGHTSAFFQNLRTDLMRLLANLEAFIDFSEEDQIEVPLSMLKQDLDQKITSIESKLSNKSTEILKQGIKIAIIGSPNAGKSTLFNQLCRRKASIVSEIPGTTRDVIDATLDIAGFPVHLIDTAGLRNDPDRLEAEGIKAAKERILNADIKILVIDSSKLPANFDRSCLHFEDAVLQEASTDESTVIVFNKADLGNLPGLMRPRDFFLSCENQSEISKFTEGLGKFLGLDHQVDQVALELRHKKHLTECLQQLKAAQKSSEIVVTAEHVQEALIEVGKLTGRVDPDEVLDIVFGSFCIGK